MLKMIRSTIFTEESIYFHKGLNVVLGDNEGSNSIGKSTLLMIIDFIFGGNTYIHHNSDMITNLGHHDFFFTLDFNGVEYHFIRGTENPKVVYISNNKLEKVEEIEDKDFTIKLKHFYEIEATQLSFRSAVSTFSRVWGKENYDVKKPLHNHPQEKYLHTVTKLIQLFNKYDSIESKDRELKILKEKSATLTKAVKYSLVPKITKREYTKNLKEIEKLISEIERIGKNAYSTSGDINELVSDEMIHLREKKNELLEEREYYKSRLNRTSRAIKSSKSAGFESLLEFFPDVNLSKINEIESFHKGIISILSEELELAKKELTHKINDIEKDIDAVIAEQDQILKPDKELTLFVDKLIEYSSKLKKLQQENGYYKKSLDIKSDITNKKEKLEELKESIIDEINETINDKLKIINDIIHQNKRTAPDFNLTSTRYDYTFFENTGTGKAYTNLIIFDLALFTTTKIPFIIHDSFLFKNIENDAVEEILSFCSSMSNQIFIAIDNIHMYNKKTRETLLHNKVIKLSKDKLLTKKDWRDKTKK